MHRLSDHKLERIFSMKGFQAAGGAFGNWSGLAPDESPLLARDTSIQELYALEWDAPWLASHRDCLPTSAFFFRPLA